MLAAKSSKMDSTRGTRVPKAWHHPHWSRYVADWTLAWAYCQDERTGVIYIHGNGDKIANMDVDCVCIPSQRLLKLHKLMQVQDGEQHPDPDGRCKSSTDTQSITAFQDLVAKYSKADDREVHDLNANFIPYVVFGNQGSKEGMWKASASHSQLTFTGYANFHPQSHGIKPLSVMAVVCGDKLVAMLRKQIQSRTAIGRYMAYGATRMVTTDRP